MYRFIEGDQSELERSETLHTEAAFFHQKVVDMLKNRKRETCEAAAHNYLSFAIQMRSWACVL